MLRARRRRLLGPALPLARDRAEPLAWLRRLLPLAALGGIWSTVVLARRRTEGLLSPESAGESLPRPAVGGVRRKLFATGMYGRYQTWSE